MWCCVKILLSLSSLRPSISHHIYSDFFCFLNLPPPLRYLHSPNLKQIEIFAPFLFWLEASKLLDILTAPCFWRRSNTSNALLFPRFCQQIKNNSEIDDFLAARGKHFTIFFSFRRSFSYENLLTVLSIGEILCLVWYRHEVCIVL